MSQAVVDRIREHNSTVYVTVGFKWRNPTVCNKPVSTEEAIRYATSPHYALTELESENGKLYLNCYTSNDMW